VVSGLWFPVFGFFSNHLCNLRNLWISFALELKHLKATTHPQITQITQIHR
jgi:hypothetical protein